MSNHWGRKTGPFHLLQQAFGYFSLSFSSARFNNTDMSKLLCVCGPAGIGKSTWCKHYIENHPDEEVFILSADEYRKKLFGTYRQFPPLRNMRIVYDEMIRQAKNLRLAKKNPTIILDTTMINDERRLYFVKQLMEFEERVLVLLKVHDYSVLLERNARRIYEKRVPDEVIIDMSRHYYDPEAECLKYFTEYFEEYRDD